MAYWEEDLEEVIRLTVFRSLEGVSAIVMRVSNYERESLLPSVCFSLALSLKAGTSP